MSTNLLNFFKRRNSLKETTDIEKQVDDMRIKIVSDTIKISESEADIIVRIVCDEMKKDTLHTGSIIAQLIAEKIKNISAVQVESDDGKEWLIKASNNPLSLLVKLDKTEDV